MSGPLSFFARPGMRPVFGWMDTWVNGLSDVPFKTISVPISTDGTIDRSPVSVTSFSVKTCFSPLRAANRLATVSPSSGSLGAG